MVRNYCLQHILIGLAGIGQAGCETHGRASLHVHILRICPFSERTIPTKIFTPTQRFALSHRTDY